MPRIALLIAAILLMPLIMAPVVAQTASAATRQATFPDRPWHLSFNLWGAGIDGNVGTPLIVADVSSDPFDDPGGFGTLSWHEPGGRLGFITSLYIMNTNPDGTIRTAAGPVPTSVDVDNSILEAAFSWNFGKPDSRIEIFGGVRHWDLDAKSSSPIAGTTFFGDSWNDLLVGAAATPRVGDNWWLEFKVDYSGGQSEGIWGAWGAVTWAFGDSAAARLGLKYFNGDFTTSKGANNFSGEVELFGPVLGLEFAF